MKRAQHRGYTMMLDDVITVNGINLMQIAGVRGTVWKNFGAKCTGKWFS